LLKPVEEVLEGSDLRLGFDDLGGNYCYTFMMYTLQANSNLAIATGHKTKGKYLKGLL